MENTYFEDITIDESLEIDAGAFSAIPASKIVKVSPKPQIIRPPIVVALYGIAIRPTIKL